jgi:hypothetical protein
MTEIANVHVGRAQVSPTRPSHVRGVRQGNQRGSFEREAGLVPAGPGAHGTAARSTGINAAARNPIDPRMPNLSPA